MLIERVSVSQGIDLSLFSFGPRLCVCVCAREQVCVQVCARAGTHVSARTRTRVRRAQVCMCMRVRLCQWPCACIIGCFAIAGSV